MTPKELIHRWVDLFNEGDTEGLAALYSPDAIDHRVPAEALMGREAIKASFAAEFHRGRLECIPENIFENGDWVILEWKDPKGFRACVFFLIHHARILFQRGYWDTLSFNRLHGIPPESGQTLQ